MKVRKILDDIEQTPAYQMVPREVRPDRRILLQWMSAELNELVSKTPNYDFWQVHLEPAIQTETGTREYDLPDDFGANFIRLDTDKWSCNLDDGTNESPVIQAAQGFYDQNLRAESNGKRSCYTIKTRQILNALSHSGYRTKDNPMIQRAVQTEVEQAAGVSAAHVDLGDNTETALLQAALNQFHVQIRDRVLSLSSFIFDGDSIRRVREALTAGSVTQVSYALEIMDAQLPAAWEENGHAAVGESFTGGTKPASGHVLPADRTEPCRAITRDRRKQKHGRLDSRLRDACRRTRR